MTAAEIAKALKVTDRAIRKRGWRAVNETGVARYNIHTIGLDNKEITRIKTYLKRQNRHHVQLPVIAQDETEAQKEAQRLEARQQSASQFAALPAWQKRAAAAKLEIIKACTRYINDCALAKIEGQNSFAHEYALGRIDVAPWVRSEIRQFHPQTLRDWIKTEYELGSMGLVDMYGNRKDQSKIETFSPDGKTQPMVDILVALVLKHPRIREKKANEALRGILLERGIHDAPLVSDKSVMRFMTKWKSQNRDQYEIACNPDNYKNNRQPAFGSRSEGITGPNQLWEIDATPADLLLTDGQRYKIIGVTDVGTARLKYYVNVTEKARDNAWAIRNCILDWGVPCNGTLVTDNGSPYIGGHFTRILHDLDIDHHVCKPFSGDEKPHIERSFRTFSHDLIELTPGYCGHSVADRKEIESRKSFAQRLMKPDEVIEVSVSAAQLQQFIDRWTAAYHNSKHDRLGKTPNQALAEWPHAIHRISDERALDMLMAEAVRRGNRLPTIGKKGIRVNGGVYIHPALGIHVGKKCRAFQDPADLGRIIVHLMNEHGVWEFLCIAEDPNRTGISMAEVASVTRALHTQHKKEIARLNREAKKAIKGVDIVDAVLTYREQENAQEQGNVTYFPRPSVEYSTPGLQAAADARAAIDGRNSMEHAIEIEAKRLTAIPQPPVQDELVQAHPRKIVPLPQKPKGFQVPEDRQARWDLWQELHARILDEDDTISDDEIRFYTSFRKSATWAAFNKIMQSAIK
nr:transposase family protein [Geoanaerobacter pelophilus]